MHSPFMRTISDEVTACRRCQSYTAEGRRGGFCQQLNAPVCGSWKACSLASAPFVATWQRLQDAIHHTPDCLDSPTATSAKLSELD